jgi:uncharacterized phage-associated protein
MSTTVSRLPPTNAAAVANCFLRLAGEEKQPVPPVDQMKLQKLLFYAQAWYLGHTGAALFEDDIEAWPWGPVVPSVYSQTRRFGRSPVTGAISRLTNGENGIHFATPQVTDPTLISFLNSVWESHKKFSGIQLSNATHASSEPWSVVKAQYGNLDGKPQIPNDLIRDIYQARVQRTANAV